MSQRKKQHYVPQFYLKKFSINYNKKSIYTLDKNENRVFPTLIKDIAQGKYFNESEGYSLENYFGKKIENLVSHSINIELDNIRSKGSVDNFHEFKKSLNIFIVSQYFRSIKTRKQFDKWYDENLFDFFVNYLDFLLDNINELNKFLKIPIIGIRLEEDTRRRFFNHIFIEYYNKILNAPKEKSKLIQIKRIIENNKNLLKFRKMELLINKTNIPLITSDEPVIIINKGNLFEYGLLNKNTEIYVPLSPTHLIHIYGIDKKLQNILEEYPHRNQHILCYLKLKDLDEKCDGFLNENLKIEELTDVDFIIKFNDFQHNNSVRNLFSKDEESLQNYL